MELPAHPEHVEPDAPHRSATSFSWSTAVAITVVAALIALMAFLHLTGAVGPGAH
jgi:hypothetical protein